MSKKNEVTLDKVLQAVNNGFTQMENRFQKLENKFDNLENRFESLEKRVIKIEKDIVWIKEILEKNSSNLKRLDEERVFTLEYAKRLENEIAFIKKHLKIA